MSVITEGEMAEAMGSQPRGKRKLPTSHWLALIVALGLPFVAAVIGAGATGNAVNTWYRTLRKPAWNPPSRIFGPVWTVLYTMMGIASWLVWRSAQEPTAANGAALDSQKKRMVNRALTLYGIHLVFNALWSVLFFGRRNIQAALAEVVVLWGLIVATLLDFYRIKPTAGWLLVPYLLWTTFATLLNAKIWQLNRHNFLARLWEKPFWRRG